MTMSNKVVLGSDIPQKYLGNEFHHDGWATTFFIIYCGNQQCPVDSILSSMTQASTTTLSFDYQ